MQTNILLSTYTATYHRYLSLQWLQILPRKLRLIQIYSIISNNSPNQLIWFLLTANYFQHCVKYNSLNFAFNEYFLMIYFGVFANFAGNACQSEVKAQ